MMRSTVESKNAPRWLAVSEALASAPSSRSGSAARMTSTRPRRSWPAPMATAAPTPTSRPRIVRWSGVRPVLRSAAPTGLTALSTGVRNLPSNIESTLSRLGGQIGVVDLGIALRGDARRRGRRWRRRGRDLVRPAGPRPSSTAPATSVGCANRARPAAPTHGRRGSRGRCWAATSASVSSTCMRQPLVIENTPDGGEHDGGSEPSLVDDGGVVEADVHDRRRSLRSPDTAHRANADGCCRGTGRGRRRPTDRGRQGVRLAGRRSSQPGY